MDANNNDAELFVVLCNDVLLQVLQHGNRRQLVKLQRIGRRFHKMIEVYFRDKPFLRLNFRLAPGFFLFFSIQNAQNLPKYVNFLSIAVLLAPLLGMDLNTLFWLHWQSSLAAGNWPSFHVSSVSTLSS